MPRGFVALLFLPIYVLIFSVYAYNMGVIPLDLCFVVSNSNIETTNLGIMGNQKCHVPTLKYILYYTPTHKG